MTVPFPHPASFLIDSSPAVIHGMVYIGSRDHKVFAFYLMAGIF